MLVVIQTIVLVYFISAMNYDYSLIL